MEVRPLRASDRPPLALLLSRIEAFSPEERSCALELIDAALMPNHPDYQVLVAVHGATVVGYICFGPTPMTQGTFDLYWIASDPQHRGLGVGRTLVSRMEEEIRGRGARLVRVETSALEAYGPTRGFYAALHYVEEARFRDFYKPGEDLVIFARRL